MGTTRKITLEVPEELLRRAQSATRTGITETVRSGLQILAASDTYERLRQLRGTIHFQQSWQELKDDR